VESARTDALAVDAQTPKRHGSPGFSRDPSLQSHLLVRILAWAALAAGLVLPTAAPEVANVTVIALMVLAIPLLWTSPDRRAILAQPAVAMPLAAGVLLVLAFAITARSWLHIAVIFYFVPLYLVGPLAALLDRLDMRDAPGVIGFAALAGTIAAVAVACLDFFVLGYVRAGASVNNPIHFADLALSLGFVALTGLFGNSKRWRAVFLLGPALAMVAVILSGSRGPMVASVPMFAVAFVLMAFWLLPRGRALQVVGGGAAAAVVLLLALMQTGMVHQIMALSDVANLMQTGATADASTNQRLVMYQSAYNAFLASPVYGYGLVDYIDAAARHVPPGLDFPRYSHLHNDIADFAVVGGLMGLCAYGLFIAAPLAGALAAPAGPHRRAAILLGALLSVGYLGMGLTNAMFGVLSQTVLFAVGLALVVHLGRAGTRRAGAP
jgi:O-antigen ligase